MDKKRIEYLDGLVAIASVIIDEKNEIKWHKEGLVSLTTMIRFIQKLDKANRVGDEFIKMVAYWGMNELILDDESGAELEEFLEEFIKVNLERSTVDNLRNLWKHVEQIPRFIGEIVDKGWAIATKDLEKLDEMNQQIREDFCKMNGEAIVVPILWKYQRYLSEYSKQYENAGRYDQYCFSKFLKEELLIPLLKFYENSIFYENNIPVTKELAEKYEIPCSDQV